MTMITHGLIRTVYSVLLVLISVQGFSQEVEDDWFCKPTCSKHAATEHSCRDFISSEKTRSLTNKYDISYHRLEWTVDPAVLYISGTVTTYFNPLVPGFNEITFDLSDSLTVTGVLYHGSPATFSTPGDNILTIDLPSIINESDMDSITVIYEGMPNNSGFGAFDTASHNGVSVLWTLSEPYGSRDWWPCKQQLTDKIDSIDVVVTCPSQYTAVSNGLLVDTITIGPDKSYSWKHRYPIPSYLIAIAVTDYDLYIEPVVLNSGDTVDVYNYIYPEDSTVWFNSFSSTSLYMKYFSDVFGDYPFKDEKYGHAQFSWAGGMEHQTISFMGGASAGLIAHELAHQWFGDKVTCSSWTDIWLNEGFATYLVGLSREEYYPNNWTNFKRDAITYITSQPDGSVWVDDTTSVDRIFDGRLTYTKGAMLLHMIRWVVGDSAFFNGVRNYLNDPDLAFSYSSTDQFIQHIETQSDTLLNEFLNDWFYGEGFPTYTIQGYQNGGKLELTVSQTTSDPSVDFFEMPLAIAAYGENKDTTYRLLNTQQFEEFIVDIPFEADSIVFDPEMWIVSANNLVNLTKRNDFLEVYPNPTSDFVYLNSDEPIISVEVYNIAGQKVLSDQMYDRYTSIDLANLASGNYVIVARTGEKEKEFKVVKI